MKTSFRVQGEIKNSYLLSNAIPHFLFLVTWIDTKFSVPDLWDSSAAKLFSANCIFKVMNTSSGGELHFKDELLKISYSQFTSIEK